MKPRTFAAALALALGALASPAAVRPEVARLLPPDAVTLVGVDIEALRDTPLFQRFVPAFSLQNDERAAMLFSAIGFDPQKDIHRLYLAADTVPGRVKSEATLTILEGRFDIAGRGSALQSIFRPVGEHRGFQLYEAGRNSEDALQNLAVLDAQTLIIGEAPRVTAAIDRWLQTAAEPSTPAPTALWQDNAHLWAATVEPDKVIGPWVDRVPGGGGPLRAIAGSMQSLAIRATALAGAVHAEAAFLCGGPDDARSLADAAQTMAAFGALTAQRDRPEIAELLSKLQIRQNEGETTLSIDLTEEQILGLRR